MTGLSTLIAAAIATGVAALGGLAGFGSEGPAPGERTALVIDSAMGRDGRDVDPRVSDTAAAVRLPRTAGEARTDLRYLHALGYRIVVAGPRASSAAGWTGVPAERAGDLSGALAGVTR